MNTFTVRLQSAQQSDVIENVRSFTGADASGAFGIMAGHERLATVLQVGLVRLQTAAGEWDYVALSGGVMLFAGDTLSISTSRYVKGTDYQKVAAAIEDVLAAEEETLRELKGSIARIEDEMTKRLWRLQREGTGGHYA